MSILTLETGWAWITFALDLRTSQRNFRFIHNAKYYSQKSDSGANPIWYGLTYIIPCFVSLKLFLPTEIYLGKFLIQRCLNWARMSRTLEQNLISRRNVPKPTGPMWDQRQMARICPDDHSPEWSEERWLNLQGSNLFSSWPKLYFKRQLKYLS